MWLSFTTLKIIAPGRRRRRRRSRRPPENAPDLHACRYANIYGEQSYPPLDGTNVWPVLMQPDAFPAVDAAHPNGLVLSKETIIDGQCVRACVYACARACVGARLPPACAYG